MDIERICWNITNDCNDNCGFCFRDYSSNPLPLENNIDIANRILDAGIRHIAFSGGEPLLYNDIFEIMEVIKKRDGQITLISNCILLNEEMLERCLEYINWLAIPVDSLNVNGIYTRNKRHIVNVKNVLKYINNKSKCNIKINSVISELNYMEVSNLYKEIIQKYECIKRWNLFEFTPARGKAIQNKEHYQLSSESDERVIQQLKALKNVREDLSIRYKHRKTLLNSYFIIAPNGNIVKTEGETEKIIGSILSEDFNCLLRKLNIDYKLYKKRIHNNQLIII